MNFELRCLLSDQKKEKKYIFFPIHGEIYCIFMWNGGDEEVGNDCLLVKMISWILFTSYNSTDWKWEYILEEKKEISRIQEKKWQNNQKMIESVVFYDNWFVSFVVLFG